MSPTLIAALGPLASVIDDTVRDLCVTNDGRVWRGTSRGLAPTDLILEPREARRIGVGLIDATGGRVDDARPLGDSALAGSFRIHVALPPIARGGPALTLRLPQQNPVGLDAFRIDGAVRSADLANESLLITGATGSGKTTLLGAVMGTFPAHERIVVLEDIPEIDSRHPHVVHLATRDANAEGAGAIDLRALVRQSLRMSPDRIVIGEVRGAELVDVLLALTSGHRGLATLHARGLEDVPDRLTALGLVAGIDPPTVARLITAAFDLVAHCERTPDGFRVRVGRFERDGNDVRVVT